MGSLGYGEGHFSVREGPVLACLELVMHLLSCPKLAVARACDSYYSSRLITTSGYPSPAALHCVACVGLPP